MATYVMLGKYSAQALPQISADRTAKAASLIEKLGGKVLSMYALLGEHDLLLVLSLPNSQQAMKASAALAKTTGIAFTTSEAVGVNEFDKLMRET